MGEYLLEVCCGSADDALAAQRGGADRVELNSSLFLGGLTPSIGALMTAREMAQIPIMAMIRPRSGGFCYTAGEFATAMRDGEQMLLHGADGLVFGFLKPDGTLDADRCRDMVRLAAGRQTVFHRAIDVVPDWRQALEQLINIGVTRVLTSGQAPNAYYGRDVIADMVTFAQGAIEILPGAGLNLSNVNDLLAYTHCTQAHIGHPKKAIDPSAMNNQGIHFGGALYPPEDQYDVTDEHYIFQMRGALG